MDIQFRKAKPGDINEAVPLIYSSGPDAFDFIFSHNTPIDAIEFLRRTFLQVGSEFAYDKHVVGTFQGKAVAIGTAYNRDAIPAYTKDAIKKIIAHYGLLKGAAVIRRGLQAEKIFPPPKTDMHYIAHIGVAPELRSQGIGTQIMNYFIEQGRELGRPCAMLDVSAENPRAQALYEALGFRVTDELISNYRNATAHVPSHRRMELAL